MKNKISNFFANIKATVSGGFKALEPSQQKALSLIVKFFALMIIFTVIAKGTAAATLPVVETKKPDSATIRKVIESDGVVKSEDVAVISIPSGVRIEKALVKPGGMVTEGDPILSYNKAEIDDAIALAEVGLHEIELNIKENNILAQYDNTALDIEGKNLEWEKDDYDSTLTNTQTTLKRAEEDYTKELRKLDDIHAKRRKEKRKKIELGYSSDEDDDKDKDDDTAYKDQVKAAEQSIESARRAYYDAQVAAGKTITDAERAILRAELNYEASKIKDAEGAATNSISNAKKLNTADKLNLDLKKQSQLLDTLKDIAKNEYQVLSTYTGTIIEILLLDGIVPSGEDKKSDFLKLSKKNSNLFVEMEFAPADSKKIKVGDKVTISDNNTFSEGKVRSIAMPNEDKKVIITTTLSDAVPIGNTVQVELAQSEKKHNTTVPLSAVHEDNIGSYVFILQEEIGVLGVEKKAVMQRVVVTEKDEKNAALSVAFYGDEKVIVSTSKPLSDFATVRTKS